MHTVTTPFNETVLKGFFPESFNTQHSSELYKHFVGNKLPEDKLFVVLGTDSGILLDYLASLALPGHRFVCVDFPEVIDFIHQTRPDFTPENKAFKVSLYRFDELQYDDLYERYQDYVIRNAIVLLTSLIVAKEQVPYKGVYSTQKEQFHRFLVDRADNRDFEKVFNQQLDSVCDLMRPLSVIKDRLKGDVPGILLGGGPSLDAVIPWLKEQQQHVIIFAASRICKRLLAEGITPDFIGSFDGQPLIFDYSKEMYAFDKTSILITGEHPYKGLIQQWSGLKMYSRRRFPWARGTEENFISDGPTVTNALFGIGVYLGIQTFYLAGVDFCFTLEGVCHESSSIESRNQQPDSIDTKAINYRGEEVGTNIQLYDARNSFEEQLARLSKTWPTLQVFNLNDGAAVMTGIEYLPVEQVVLTDKKVDVVTEFKAELQFDVNTDTAFIDQLKQDVKSHAKWFFNIIRDAKKGLILCDTLFEDANKQSQRIKEVLKLKTRLEKALGIDYMTLVNYGYKTFMTTLKPIESEQDMSQQEMSNALIGFFGGLQVAAEGFLRKLDDVKHNIAEREEELSANTDFDCLAQRWLAQGVPGRWQVWLEHYAPQPYEYYQTHFAPQVALLEQQFNTMKTDESALERAFKERLSTPEEFISRLQNAFESKDLQVVEHIVRQLSKLTDSAFSLAKMYAAGLRQELKGNAKEALMHYLYVDPNKQSQIIQQHVFPLAFALNEYQVGCDALAIISYHNVRYLPLYADALILLGETEQAIGAYLNYPFLHEDTGAFIGLLRLYVQKGQIEHANRLLELAEQSPKIDQQQLQAFVDSLNQAV